MKFKKYINEEALKIIELLKKDCNPYLKSLSKQNFKSGELLFSGRNDTKTFLKKSIRIGRKPRDTPYDIHKWVDDWFKSKFGIRARSETVFCYNNSSQSGAYGKTTYMIFPIGKFKIIYNKEIMDLYNKAHMDKGLDWWKEYYFFNKVADKYYITDKMSEVNKYDTELMLSCKEYYMLSFHTEIAMMVLNHFQGK